MAFLGDVKEGEKLELRWRRKGGLEHGGGVNQVLRWRQVEAGNVVPGV